MIDEATPLLLCDSKITKWKRGIQVLNAQKQCGDFSFYEMQVRIWGCEPVNQKEKVLFEKEKVLC